MTPFTIFLACKAHPQAHPLRSLTLLTLLTALSLSAVGCDSDDSTPSPQAGEAGVEAGAESGVEAGVEAGVGAGTESGVEAGTESGVMGGAMGGEEEPPPIEAPIIRRVRAYINRQDGGLGLEIIGRDEDNNVLGFKLEYFYDDGTALQLGEQPGPIAVQFNNLRQGNGDYIGLWSVPFLLENRAEIERLARVQVSIIDETEYESPVSDIELLPTPTSAEGEECDVKRGMSRCDEGQLCKTRAGGRTECAPAVAECPDHYNAIDLNAAGGRYEGDTTEKPTLGVGFCGGGTGSEVFSFTADTSGEYAFTSTPTSASEEAPTGPDTLMWIRSHCEFSDWVAELGCNDDINVAAGDLASRITLNLEAGQTVYIFIDGYADIESGMPGWSGQYILEAVAL